MRYSAKFHWVSGVQSERGWTQKVEAESASGCLSKVAAAALQAANAARDRAAKGEQVLTGGRGVVASVTEHDGDPVGFVRVYADLDGLADRLDAIRIACAKEWTGPYWAMRDPDGEVRSPMEPWTSVEAEAKAVRAREWGAPNAAGWEEFAAKLRQIEDDTRLAAAYGAMAVEAARGGQLSLVIAQAEAAFSCEQRHYATAPRWRRFRDAVRRLTSALEYRAEVILLQEDKQ